MHPTLKETGVSWLKLHDYHNLTIFSKNGATIKHAGIIFEGGTTNVIIRNLVFDELWEWDEQTSGDYDRNDWDYMSVQDDAEGIWIDHCTFYKSYDGIIDIKNKSKELQRVTVSWCEMLPGSKDNTFFNAQMDWLENHINETTYYRKLRQTENMSAKDVWYSAYGQKKAHLLGSNDKDTQDAAIRATFANNYYKNVMSRLPRLRYGKVHEYNCVMDSQELHTQYKGGNSHITGNGAISTCNGQMLLENCFINGVRTPVKSGQGTVTGLINTVNCLYHMDGVETELKIVEDGTGGLKLTDAAKFRENLPYKNYTTYDASELMTRVAPYAGAGKLDMTTVQWERTNYSSSSEGDDNPPTEPTTIDAPTASPAEEAQFPSTGGEITLDCTTDGATIYYTISDTEAGLTDPADAANANRVAYEKGTKIPITKETYIWAVAVKDNKTSEPLKCHYTVLAEGAVVRPAAKPGPAYPVVSGTTITLTTTDTVDTIYYTTGSTPDAAADPTKEDSGRLPYNSETGIVITEAVTIKAVAKKGDKYSEVAVFTYTIKEEDPEEKDRVKAPAATPAAGEVAAGTQVVLASATEGATIYYTTDNTDPTAQSAECKGSITITEAVTIKAYAVKEGLKDSRIVSFAYTIATKPVDPEVPVEPDDPGVDKKDIWITGLEETYAYTGAKIIPDIKVWDCDIKGGDRLLVPGVDYAASFKNNVKPGNKTAEVIIAGKGNYAGKGVTEKFSIKEADEVKDLISVKGAKIEKITPQNYTGKAFYPDFKLIPKGKSAVTYEYNEETGRYARADEQPMDINVAVSNNVNKGNATIFVSGAKEKGKTTSVKATFKILPADLSKAVVEVEAGVYAVKGAVPGTLKVTLGGKTLVNGRDYTAKLGNNKKAGGQGTVTISGKGNYTKKAQPKTFAISKLDMSTLTVNAVTVFEGVMAGKVKATVVDRDGNALKPAQYTVKIYKTADGPEAYGAKDKLTAGATVYVEAAYKDNVNLTGSTPRAEFKVGKDISKAKFALKKGLKKAYTGIPVQLEEGDMTVTLRGVSGQLKLGEDYVIAAYSNNINKGTATAVIKGIGDYSGTKTVKFKITQKTMKKGSLAN